MTVAGGMDEPQIGVPGRIGSNDRTKDFAPGFNSGRTNKYRHENMMKKTLLLAALTVMAATGVSAQIINEVYAGGGASTGSPSYTRDFVELYNPTALAISLNGYALQYASASGNFTGTIVLFGPGSIIAAGDYLSIQTGAAGTSGATLTAGTGAGFVTYSAPASSASLSNSSGSVRLIDASSNVVDLIGFGGVNAAPDGSAKFEGSNPSVAPSNTASSLNRTGFVDSNDNRADFTNMTPSPNAGTLSVVVPAPEPSTWAALVGGAGVLFMVLRRRRIA